MTTQPDRAVAALLGLAIGDAMGMPTQAMNPADIRADYGPITGLMAAGPRQLIAADLPAGTITDDTEQALLLARLLVDGRGVVDPADFAQALLAWERAMAAKGSLDLLGPSTKRAVELIALGTPPDEAGRHGATNGAAMRITPVGIAVPPDPLDRLVDAVVTASKVTHNTSIGLAAAAAVGAAVSCGIEGATLSESLPVAIEAADRVARQGHWVAGGQIGPRIAWAVDHLRRTPAPRWAHELDAVIGTDVLAQESVVAAFAIVAVVETPWQAVCLAASIGGDTDTIAAIAGAISGAHSGPSAWPSDVVEVVLEVNSLDLTTLAEDLLRLRAGGVRTR